MKWIISFVFTLAFNLQVYGIESDQKFLLEDLSLVIKSIDSRQLDETSLKKIEVFSQKLLASISHIKSQAEYLKRPLSGGELLELHTLINCFTKLASHISIKIDKLSSDNIHSYEFVRSNVILGILSYRLSNEIIHSQKLVNILSYSDQSFDLKKREFLSLLKVLSSKQFKKETLILMKNLSQTEIEQIKFYPDFDDAFDLKKDLHTELRSLIFKNKIFKAQRFALHHLSGAFGNTSGAIRWRKGYLFNNESIISQIESELKPLDIITEKTAFALTDKFIPGHFGHNAIWLGTKDQLIEIGIWDHPTILPFHKDIEQGFSIIETDRSGTHLKKLSDFMNVDEFATLRINNLGSNLVQYYQIALSQLGKKYDFNFDVESTDRLVCSELLYQTFAHIIWPTEKYLGRFTISPDNVVSLSLFMQSPLVLVNYIAGTQSGEIQYKDSDDLVRDINFNQTVMYQSPRTAVDYTSLLSNIHGTDFYKLKWFK